MNFEEFISKDKTLLIAPAGYGKTYILAKCITHTPDNEKQLILTHTHAGVASIKEKIKKFDISISKYHIETITGFSQKYVLAYYCQNDIPEIEDSAKYYPFIIKKAEELFQLESVKRTIKYSFQGLFVDEYQDCTISQHKMLMTLSETLPIHILGDPMQGIFGFSEKLVDFENDLKDFNKVDELDIPWRWKVNGNNQNLGSILETIRQILLSDEKTIDLLSFSTSIKSIKISESDIFNNSSNYRNELNYLITNPENKQYLKSILLIVPEYTEANIPKGRINSRAILKSQIDFSDQFRLLEAIDDRAYYSISKNIDILIRNLGRRNKKIKALSEEIFFKLFNKSNVKAWINVNSNKLINKRKDEKIIKERLEEKINLFIGKPSILSLLKIILFMKKEMKFKSKRTDLLTSIIKSMQIASTENKSVYASMVSHKNIIRRMGRKVHGKCIGTTLLTKGLEFDTVVVLNTHRFEDFKHFYVAITRACKKLVIFSENEILNYN